MALQSMTGFSRAEGEALSVGWIWEARSVNGKGLDIRFRLPPACAWLEADCRRIVGSALTRGNIQLSLTLSDSHASVVPVLNEAAFDAAIRIAERARQATGAAPVSVDGLLSIRGVVEVRENSPDEADRDKTNRILLDGLTKAVEALVSARRSEGDALAEIVSRHLDSIHRLTQSIEHDASRSPDAIRERLAAQVALLADTPSIDRQRLHAEAVLLAAKADLREEIDRLNAHVAAGRDLLEKGGPVGRRLDFLSQEFNREANTICSKSNAASITALGMELKIVVDQLREQVQNLE